MQPRPAVPPHRGQEPEAYAELVEQPAPGLRQVGTLSLKL
jgi:hypothetical protein